MNKVFRLSIFTIALAMAFMFAAPYASMAASDNYNKVFIGSTNLIGVDEADNAIALPDRDKDMAPPVLDFQTYGLHGDWAGQQ